MCPAKLFYYPAMKAYDIKTAHLPGCTGTKPVKIGKPVPIPNEVLNLNDYVGATLSTEFVGEGTCAQHGVDSAKAISRKDLG